MLKDFNEHDDADSKDVMKFRAMVYGFSILLQYFSLDITNDYIRRLERLEVAIENGTIKRRRAEDREDPANGETNAASVLDGTNISG